MRVRGFLYSALAVSLGVAAFAAFLASMSSPALADAAPERKPPVPKEQGNCVKCHLTAGRELTEAVHTFAHSVHDLDAGLTCHDCHGGNTKEDDKAHLAEFGFIGTKLSAHLAKCQECHKDQHDLLESGPHQWDHQKRLNIQRPLCVDCHGNHDIGNPPKEFSMTVVCMECHRGYKAKFPEYAKLTDAHDSLWTAILAWQSKHPDSPTRVPEALADNLAEIRKLTSEIIHPSQKLDAERANAVAAKIHEFIPKLQSQATARADSKPKGR